MTTLDTREPIVLVNNGQKIFGILHLPKDAIKPPCILICHGLGGHKTGRYRAYVELSESLVKRGIAVFRFDFRGSGDSEGDFAEMTLNGEVSDALVAFQYLLGEGRIDKDKIGVFGRSLGGAVSVLSAASFGHVKCIALWAPIFNGDQWKMQWEKVKNGVVSENESNEMRRINGQVAGIPFYMEMFDMKITEALEKLKNIPLLLIHGEKDNLVTIHHSELYVEERTNLVATTEFVRLPEGDHDFSFTEERYFAIEKTAEWFKRGLI